MHNHTDLTGIDTLIVDIQGTLVNHNRTVNRPVLEFVTSAAEQGIDLIVWSGLGAEAGQKFLADHNLDGIGWSKGHLMELIKYLGGRTTLLIDDDRSILEEMAEDVEDLYTLDPANVT